MIFTIEDVIPRFETFRVGVVLADGLVVTDQRTAAERQAIQTIEDEAAAWLRGVALADIPELRAWRDAYKAFGVKKTSYRSSVERLLKRVGQGSGLPEVNALVDAYNAISLRYRMPIGADDLDRVVPPLAFRFAHPDDTFIRLGDEDRAPDPPAVGEVVYADAEKCLCRRWNWSQDARSAVSVATRRAVLTVQTLDASTGARVEAAVVELCALLAGACDSRTVWAVADREHPTITLSLR